MGKIIIDQSEIIEAMADIKEFIRSKSTQDVPEIFLELANKLRLDNFKDITIFGAGTTTGAGDHIIRLRVAGILKVLAAAVRTGDFDGVLAHNSSP